MRRGISCSEYQLKHLPVVDKDLRIVGTVALSDITPGKRSQKES